MHEHDWLAERFEENRPHLRAVAYRMLGSSAEADDAVQEAWLRLSRAGTGGVDNLGGWLTTIDFDALLTMLDPDIVLRADNAAAQMGADADPERIARLEVTPLKAGLRTRQA